MDKLIAIEEMEFDLSTATSANQKADVEINPEKYRNYLSINPIWNFLSLSKEEYFKLSIEGSGDIYYQCLASSDFTI